MTNNLERWVGKLAIVSGASSGIGKAISIQLVKAGINVLGTARREERLINVSEQLLNEKGKFYPFASDFSKEEDILNAFKWAEDNIGPVHILINNAGVRRNTNLISGDTELWKNIIDTNVMGLCIATREALRIMNKNNIDGHIIHMNSLSGHKIVYNSQSSVYPASKFAVTALTETLRQELNSIGSKIKITSISPGWVDTNFRRDSNLETFDHLPALESEDVADSVMYVLGTPPHVQIAKAKTRKRNKRESISSSSSEEESITPIIMDSDNTDEFLDTLLEAEVEEEEDANDNDNNKENLNSTGSMKVSVGSWILGKYYTKQIYQTLRGTCIRTYG
ncbi:hypothetical protein FQR65_LT09796 [Abscondita terminalis]|nr:hypothetical protein FQR65_LT09796 [Abscondita terminalis]